MFRLVRLLGKNTVEAVNDPALNAIFLAWDTVVPGWGERESVATKEEGAKNAKIEANSGEAQAIEPQKDTAHNPESEGEKRSQLRDEDPLGHG